MGRVSGFVGGRSSSYGHRIQRLGADWFRLSWTVDTKHRRIRYPHGYSRDTDLKGATRFAKKWGVTVPPEKTGL